MQDSGHFYKQKAALTKILAQRAGELEDAIQRLRDGNDLDAKERAFAIEVERQKFSEFTAAYEELRTFVNARNGNASN